MATVEKVIRSVPAMTFVNTFVLEIDQDEAQVLHDILSRVGGDQLTSRRRFTDSIYHALQQASTFVDDDEVYDDVHSVDNSIYFLG